MHISDSNGCYTHDETKSRLKSANAHSHSFHNLLPSSSLVFKMLKHSNT